MRTASPLPTDVRRLLREQSGAVTPDQLLALGVSERRIRTLRTAGWGCRIRGALVDPEAEPIRANTRAAQLVVPSGAASGLTAARLHGFSALPEYRSTEPVQLLLPKGRTYEQRSGILLRSGLLPGETVRIGGLVTTAVDRTLAGLVGSFSVDELVCVLDGLLSTGWSPCPGARTHRKLLMALALADARSESPLETRLRLLLVRAGLTPESIQFTVVDRDGRVYARLDLAWPSLKLAVEADGRAFHDLPRGITKDRARDTRLQAAGWTVLRFTHTDIESSPDWLIDQVRQTRDRLSRQ